MSLINWSKAKVPPVVGNGYSQRLAIFKFVRWDNAIVICVPDPPDNARYSLSYQKNPDTYSSLSILRLIFANARAVSMAAFSRRETLVKSLYSS